VSSRKHAEPRGENVLEQIARALVAAAHFRRHRVHDDIADQLGDRGVLQPRRRDELPRHQLVEVRWGGRVVRQHSRQHLIHRHPHRIDVGGKHGLAVELLGCHVGGAADDSRAVRRYFQEARGSEVGHLEHVVLGDEHVRRPKVAVDDALPVGVIDGIADLAGEIERPVQLERTIGGDDVLERLARNVLHHDEEDVLFLLRRDDRNDIRMADARQKTRFAQQLPEVEILPVGHLDGDAFVDPGVLREVHRAEPAAAERSDDLVLPERLTLKEQC
jgi:hypothetical protein